MVRHSSGGTGLTERFLTETVCFEGFEGLVFLRHGHVVILATIKLRELALVVVIADDARDLAGQLADLMAIEQVSQAVPAQLKAKWTR